MTGYGRAALAASVICIASGAAWAGVDLAKVDACIATQAQGGQSPTSCIEQAHTDCIAIPQNTPDAAAACFAEAAKVWVDGIAAVNAEIAGRAQPDVAAVAEIDSRYDLQAGQLECSRMAELARASGQVPEEVIAAQTNSCQAATAALAYARLRWRGNTLP